MKKLIIILLLFSGCKSSVFKMINGGVSQEADPDCKGLTTSESCIVTYVWDNENIVWSSYLNISASKKQIDSVKRRADSVYSHIKGL